MKQFIISVVVVLAFFSASCPSWAQEANNGVNDANANNDSLPGTRVPSERRIVLPVRTPTLVDVPVEASPAPSRVEVTHSGKVQLELTQPAPLPVKTVYKYRNRYNRRANHSHLERRAVTPAPAEKPQPANPPVSPAKGGGVMPQNGMDFQTLGLLVLAIIAILALCFFAFRPNQGQQGNRAITTTPQYGRHLFDPNREPAQSMNGIDNVGSRNITTIDADGSMTIERATSVETDTVRALSHAQRMANIYAMFGGQSAPASQEALHTHSETIPPVYVGEPKTVVPERMPKKVKKSKKPVAEPAEPAADTAKPAEPAEPATKPAPTPTSKAAPKTAAKKTTTGKPATTTT